LSEWLIFYGDGSTYGNEDGAPWDAPALDVQVIVMSKPYQTQAKEHFYVWDNRGEGWRWYGCNEFGMYDYLMKPGWKKVIFGRKIARADFAHILQRAHKDTKWARQ